MVNYLVKIWDGCKTSYGATTDFCAHPLSKNNRMKRRHDRMANMNAEYWKAHHPARDAVETDLAFVKETSWHPWYKFVWGGKGPRRMLVTGLVATLVGIAAAVTVQGESVTSTAVLHQGESVTSSTRGDKDKAKTNKGKDQ